VDIQPFRISIPQEVLDDLHERLARTRWPDEVHGAGWCYGANLAYIRELAEYWQTTFDWRAQEERLNGLPHYRAVVDGLGIHLVHERGKGPDPLPLLISHGWPSTFAEMTELIPLLTDPAAHGGDPVDSFDVIVPSLPGFGFSDRPLEAGFTRWRVAALFAKLMAGLGYERYGLHANDIGAVISAWLAIDFPERVIALQTMMPTFPPPAFGEGEPPMTGAEEAFAATVAGWQQEEGGYDAIQATRPQTLAYGLNDSPVGLLAWIVEKWRAWTDPDRGVEKYFSKDELLTEVMIYWVTETINSANRSYYERAHDTRKLRPEEKISVPTGVALTTEAVERAPREWVERRYSEIRRWTEFSRGGHFMAAEEPEMLAAEIRGLFRQFR
jgi:pimeloyl-ACP methyl ester carboxylesterase